MRAISLFCGLIYLTIVLSEESATNGVSSTCEDSRNVFSSNRCNVALSKVGEKFYYLGIFLKLNWYKANQYCRYHGMDLASISSEEENVELIKTFQDFGFNTGIFWVSGTDLGSEGSFYWLSNGRPLSYTDFDHNQPNNWVSKNNETQNCLALWKEAKDGGSYKWHDMQCSTPYHFVCELQ